MVADEGRFKRHSGAWCVWNVGLERGGRQFEPKFEVAARGSAAFWSRTRSARALEGGKSSEGRPSYGSKSVPLKPKLWVSCQVFVFLTGKTWSGKSPKALRGIETDDADHINQDRRDHVRGKSPKALRGIETCCRSSLLSCRDSVPTGGKSPKALRGIETMATSSASMASIGWEIS